MNPRHSRLRQAALVAALLAAGACAPPEAARAQTLSSAIASAPDGVARFRFPARAGVCGWSEGVGYRDPQDPERRFTFFYNGNRGRGNDFSTCAAGPIVVDLSVRDRRVVNVRVGVGEGASSTPGRLTDLGEVGAQEAARYLLGVAEAGEAEESDRALLAGVLAADVDLSPDLLRLGRDSSIDDGTREQAVFLVALLGSRAAVRQLHALVEESSLDDGLRGHAIFALSQTHTEEDATFLRGLYPRLTSADLKEKTIFAISQLREEWRGRWLVDAAQNQRESADLREKAIFWAAETGTSLADLQTLYSQLDDRRLKEQVIFAYSRRREPAATAHLLTLARTDPDPELREKAIFWLGQAAGREIARDLATLAQDGNQNRKIQEQAVFALSQRPREEGIPALLEIARTHRDTEVRKTALFWLSQSRDQRALDLFQEILQR